MRAVDDTTVVVRCLLSVDRIRLLYRKPSLMLRKSLRPRSVEPVCCHAEEASLHMDGVRYEDSNA